MLTSDNLTGSLRISPSVKETASEDGAVLLDVDQGVCFSLNSLGLRIWELLKQGNNIDQIVIELERHYTVSRTQLLEDIHKFVDELESRKLLLNPKANNANEEKKGFFTRLWRRRQSA